MLIRCNKEINILQIASCKAIGDTSEGHACKGSTTQSFEEHLQQQLMCLQCHRYIIFHPCDASQAGTGVKAWWQSLPPITRWMATLMLVITVGANLGFIPPMWLVLMWQPIIKKFEVRA